MEKKTLLLALATVLVLSTIFSRQSILLASANDPFELEVIVTPEYPSSNDNVNVTVSFFFATFPPNVQEFGNLTQEGNVFSVDVTIYIPAFDEPVLQILHTDSHTYQLGKLPPGVSQFEIWVMTIHGSSGYWLEETVNITVTSDNEQLKLRTDRLVYALGQNVTITLLNVGNETVEIGGYPAWQIFTYPEEEPVYPQDFVYLAWSLEPGENDTIAWNQFNEFNQNYVDPGTYVIRDNQGWGLNWYFKIVDAEIIVPDDYSTIQEAIDHANPGDTIYVRWRVYEGGLVVDKTVTIIGEKISPLFDYPIVGGVICVYASGVSISRLMTHPPMFPSNGVYLKNVSNCKISEMITSVDEGSGIWLSGSSNNLIAYNTARGLVWDGIRLEYSHNNTIIGNDVTMDWVDYGISLMQSSGNVVSDNNIANAYTGIKLTRSFDNKIYHNNFMDMRAHAIESHESMNVWDDGCEGNYWSDYEGEDENGDGIGDTPYIIDSDNQDLYPLMTEFWNPSDVTHDGKVDIRDITVVAMSFGSKPGDENWNQIADLNEDEVIDIRDITIVALEFGKTA